MDLHLSETAVSMLMGLIALYGLYRLGCRRESEPPADETIYDGGKHGSQR